MSHTRVLPIVLALFAAAAAVVVRRHRTAPTVTTAQGGAPAPRQTPAAKAVEQTFRCECGQEFRVRGEDRHRVYWITGAAASDPVLDPVCPSCERPLPHDHEHPTTPA